MEPLTPTYYRPNETIQFKIVFYAATPVGAKRLKNLRLIPFAIGAMYIGDLRLDGLDLSH